MHKRGALLGHASYLASKCRLPACSTTHLPHHCLPTPPCSAPRQAVQDVADSGRCCVLDIDVQGARQVRSWTPFVLIDGAAERLGSMAHRGWAPVSKTLFVKMSTCKCQPASPAVSGAQGAAQGYLCVHRAALAGGAGAPAAWPRHGCAPLCTGRRLAVGYRRTAEAARSSALACFLSRRMPCSCRTLAHMALGLGLHSTHAGLALAPLTSPCRRLGGADHHAAAQRAGGAAQRGGGGPVRLRHCQQRCAAAGCVLSGSACHPEQLLPHAGCCAPCHHVLTLLATPSTSTCRPGCRVSAADSGGAALPGRRGWWPGEQRRCGSSRRRRGRGGSDSGECRQRWSGRSQRAHQPRQCSQRQHQVCSHLQRLAAIAAAAAGRRSARRAAAGALDAIEDVLCLFQRVQRVQRVEFAVVPAGQLMALLFHHASLRAPLLSCHCRLSSRRWQQRTALSGTAARWRL